MVALLFLMSTPTCLWADNCLSGKAAYELLRNQGGTEASFSYPWLPVGEEVQMLLQTGKEAKAVNVYAAPLHDAENVNAWTLLRTLRSSYDPQAGTRTLTVSLRNPKIESSFFPTVYLFAVVGCENQGASTGQLSFGSIVQAKVVSNGLALTGVVIVVLFLAAVIAFWIRQNTASGRASELKRALWLLFVDFSNRISLARVQVAFFSLIVIVMTTYILLRTGTLGDFSDDILLLLGISAGGAAGAGLGDNIKKRLSWENWLWLDRVGALKSVDEADLRISTLVSTGGQFDVFRVQALFFSGLIGIAILLSGLTGLGTFKIPAGMLGLLGLSQVAYIGGKAVATPTMADFDKQLSEYQKIQSPSDEQADAVKRGFKAAFGYEPVAWVLGQREWTDTTIR
jgi:hypothetical protein